jgi:hypothetical protein
MEKVVAAILVPANHQGSDRPETKKSSKLREARRESNIPNQVVRAKYTRIISQSIVVMVEVYFKVPHYNSDMNYLALVLGNSALTDRFIFPDIGDRQYQNQLTQKFKKIRFNSQWAFS